MKKGILLPIFSLPSKYGVGDFGYEAYEFIDILRDNGIDYWEILPINEGGKYPYSPISFYALNKWYISLDKLKEMGLVDSPMPKSYTKRIVYDDYKEKYYIEAYNNFNFSNTEYLEFAKNVKIEQFAKYMSKREGKDKKYYLFLQFILFKQWKELKSYANANNVKIIGDLPIYPDYNSVEIEYYSDFYDLVDGKMEYVSGASPDYFNSEGQKWGHPLYNFDEMEKDNYTYLVQRYLNCVNMYDITRIDHFRAFDTYFKIPVNESAKFGFYVEGPGEKFFNELFKYTTSDKFIVEDLGDIRKETEELRDKYNFMKMKILHYTINLETLVDDFEDTENMIVYTGNHDNNTTIGWYNSLSENEKEKLIEFLKREECFDGTIHFSMIKYALKSNAKIVMIPVQDILGLDENSRINLPGHEFEDNWSWKLDDFDEFKKLITKF